MPGKDLKKDTNLLTSKILLEIASHEGAVLEAYLDSRGIWTWGIGVTNASGHTVNRYKDFPQTLQKVLEIYKWLLETRYLPQVLSAFRGYDLKENELAAALSFHYNTGAIDRASWVKSFINGDKTKARDQFLQWNKPAEIMERRRKEAALLFDGVWSGDGKINVYPVKKPSYTPDWKNVRRVVMTL